MTVHITDRFGAPLTPFRTVAELRDAVLATPLPAPEIVKTWSPGEQVEHELLIDSIAAVRNGRMFAFAPFDVNSDAFHELSCNAGDAFADGAIGLPYQTFCGVAGLTLYGETRLAMVSAKAVDNLVGIDGCDLGEGWHIHAVVPYSRPDGGVWFEGVSRLQRVFAEGGKTFGRPVEPPVGDFAIDMLDRQIRVLFAMLAMIADRRVDVSRSVPDLKLNAARARRGRPPIPALWRVGASPALEAHTTKILPVRPHGEGRGRHHRPPVPHDRRGHSRRLRGGKICWVRPSRVGEFDRHLTRHRSFYELAGGTPS